MRALYFVEKILTPAGTDRRCIEFLCRKKTCLAVLLPPFLSLFRFVFLLLSHDAFENVHEFFDFGVVLVLGKGSWVRLHLANEEGMKKKKHKHEDGHY